MRLGPRRWQLFDSMEPSLQPIKVQIALEIPGVRLGEELIPLHALLPDQTLSDRYCPVGSAPLQLQQSQCNPCRPADIAQG